MSDRCRRGHLRYPASVRPSDGCCRRCVKLAEQRGDAKRYGYPLCEQGHGLVPAAVDENGQCRECYPQPPAPPAEWLDWVAVDQAIRGLVLVRPLTKYETLCAVMTVRRRNSWERTEATEWLRENTAVDVSYEHAEWLETVWARRCGLRPLTLNEAITYENPADEHIAGWAEEEPLEDEELEEVA